MDGYLAWVLLFVGNAALFVLWVHYILRVLFGECPHCGESRMRPILSFLASFRSPVSANDKQGAAHNH